MMKYFLPSAPSCAANASS